MTDRDRLEAQLRRHEALKLKPYVDSVGKLTIGYGRNLDDVGLYLNEAEFMLDNDVDRCVRALERAFPWFARLDPVRQSVLTNMCFNLGLPKLQKFARTLEAIQKGQFGLASQEMLASLWAGQVGQRALELAAQMKTGQWQV